MLCLLVWVSVVCRRPVAVLCAPAYHPKWNWIWQLNIEAFPIPFGVVSGFSSGHKTDPVINVKSPFTELN